MLSFKSIEERSNFDEYGPEKVIIVRDPSINMIGALVIDNSVYGLPVGGIRMAPNLSLEEIIRLARGMTLKYCTYKIPLSGAKAGIICGQDLEQKNMHLNSFIFSIKAMIKRADYYPEPDLGLFNTDYEKIFNILSKPKILPDKLGFMRLEKPIKMEYKGDSVFYCMKTLLQKISMRFLEKRNLTIEAPITVLLEGFGRVGKKLAHLINQDNMRLLGISTIKGAIFDEDGLDVNRLFELQEKFGDDVVNEYDGKNTFKTNRSKLFELSSEYDVDFIVPGARPDIINKNNVEKINAKAVIPASSMPYSEEVLKNLKEYTFLAIPDFISNAGDILELSSRRKTKDSPSAETQIEKEVSSKTIEILKLSQERNVEPYSIARNNAMGELMKKMKLKEQRFKQYQYA